MFHMCLKIVQDRDFYICLLNQAYFLVQLIYGLTNFFSAYTSNTVMHHIMFHSSCA